MQQEIINYPFDEIIDDVSERSDSFNQSPEEGFLNGGDTNGANISYVNGHNLPDDDDDDEDDDDLTLGDEDDLDDADLAEEEVDVEIDEEPDVSDDDLALDEEDDDEDEDDDV